jgi:hypothetical protein
MGSSHLSTVSCSVKNASGGGWLWASPISTSPSFLHLSNAGYGVVAQLGERFTGSEEVAGSKPTYSTGHIHVFDKHYML